MNIKLKQAYMHLFIYFLDVLIGPGGGRQVCGFWLVAWQSTVFYNLILFEY